MRAYYAYPRMQIFVFLGRNSKRVLRFLDRVLVETFLTTFCLFLLVAILMPFFLLFLASGRIRIAGIKNLKGVPLKNVLFIANHPSFLEPFLLPIIIALVTLMRGIVTVRVIPWQTPDRKNFRWFIRGLPFRVFRCFPVEKDKNGERNDIRVYRFLKRMIPEDWILVFVEGTRSSKAVAAGRQLYETAIHHVPIGKPKEGVGGLLGKGTKMLPILVIGAEKTMPVGNNAFQAFWKIWSNPISIVFGELVALTVPTEVPKRQQRQWYAEESLRRVASLDRKRIPTIWGLLFDKR